MILKNTDILLMIVLYIAGVNRIDIYRMSLLIIFALFIIYPKPFRKNFVLLLYYIIFMVTIKYLYVIFNDEIRSHKTLNNWLKVIGFHADVNEGRVYGRGSIFNSNYAILIAAFIQYRLYTSDSSKKAFSSEQATKDLNTFSAKFPKLTKILMLSIEILQMFIPWITYVVFFMISIVITKNVFNLIILFFIMLLLFWHISSDLVTKKSHQRLTKGWGAFTILAALIFLTLVIFQILALEQISNLEITQDFLNWVPNILIENRKVIGLHYYKDYSSLEIALKFLAYVAYFNLSIITKRQLERSAEKVKAYEVNKLANIVDLISGNSHEEEENSVMEVKFSLVFVVHKCKVLWPVLNMLSMHSFTILSVAIVLLAMHWKLSAASLVYIILIMIYYILTPFYLQPNTNQSGNKFKESLNVNKMKELWKDEDKCARKAIIGLRNKMVGLISFFTLI